MSKKKVNSTRKPKKKKAPRCQKEIQCPGLDIAGQGETVEEARDNLKKVLELFIECTSPEEVKQLLHSEVFVTQVEVSIA